MRNLELSGEALNKSLEYYSSLWRLKDLQKLTQTPTGHIYKVTSIHGPAVLKIFTDIGIKDELGGTTFLRAMSGRSCANLFEYDERAQLIEYLPGNSLYLYSRENRENEATSVFINIIKNIQEVEVPELRDGLVTLNYLFRLFDRITPPEHLVENFHEARILSEKLLATQTNEVLLHGDLHHENILKNSADEYVCFDPKGMVGDPSYELATTLKNPWDYSEISQSIEMFQKRASRFANELNLPLDRIIGFTFVHLVLSIGWAIEDGGSYSHQEKLLLKVRDFI